MSTPFSDSELGAFVDGELAGPRATALRAALDGDAALAARVQRLELQRQRLARAFAIDDGDRAPAPRLDAVAAALASALAARTAADTVPPAAPTSSVTSLEEARARLRPPSAPVRRPAWTGGWAMAAGVVLAAVIGVVVGRQTAGNAGATLAFDERAGTLVARGDLDRALDRALASEGGTSAEKVAVQLSFVDRSGAYCRTFSQGAVAGLACRGAGQWQVHALAAAEVAAPGSMRQAATGLPAELLSAVDRRAAGPTLDAAAERAARDRGWQR